MDINKQVGKHSIIGSSQGIQDVFNIVDKVATSDSTIMILDLNFVQTQSKVLS